MNDSTFKPLDLRDVIKSLGWTISGSIQESVFICSNPKFPQRQIIFPKKDNSPDYKEASLRAIQKLSELHRISANNIAFSIKNVRDDVVKYRISTTRTDDDSLPLEFAGEIIKGAELMLLSSACTVIRPQVHHPRLSLSEAVELLSRARLGQTEQGSFIFKVSCPVDAIDMQPSLNLGGEDNSFARSTMLGIKHGVNAIVSAVEADELNELVDVARASPSPIISSNLCEALIRFHHEDIRNNVDLSFQWSPRIRLPQSESHSEIISIRSEYFERIDQIRRELRSIEREREESFFGTVEQLNGTMGDDGRRSGEAVLGLLVDGAIVKARVLLDADDYSKALTAHKHDQWLVTLEGKLHPGRQPRALSSLRSFRVIDPTTAAESKSE